ncbi:hypothetical protein R5R35_003937 [Gryllus longicercus]|uniref:Uncharacterized protein n=1 Tax=Gryllus longicercus TaxID=2509291 RepID=A0AAN9Z744_9ORTH
MRAAVASDSRLQPRERNPLPLSEPVRFSRSWFSHARRPKDFPSPPWKIGSAALFPEFNPDPPSREAEQHESVQWRDELRGAAVAPSLFCASHRVASSEAGADVFNTPRRAHLQRGAIQRFCNAPDSAVHTAAHWWNITSHELDQGIDIRNTN